MPGFDATGPWGQGPGSGWGRGPCGAGLRRGGGRGRGLGRGAMGPGPGVGLRGNRGGVGPGRFGAFGPGEVSASGSPGNEATTLREEESSLKAELEAVQRRLAELEGVQS